MKLFEQTYYGESLNDLGRDISEAFQIEFNPAAANIPADKYGLLKGSFIVTIEWVPE